MNAAWILFPFFLACALAWFAGYARGRRIELKRCGDLLIGAFQYRASGSIRWVLHAIQNDRDELEDPDIFFGKSPK